MACLALSISLAMPVLAVRVEPIYEMMYLMSPAVAQFFMPVQKTDEDNGIKMEVVSASIHENVAEIYITMQDLTENRVDATTDLYDNYSIHRPFDSVAHCQRVGYEEATKTATFLVTIEEWGNQTISGDKITFSTGAFLSHKTIYEDLKIPFDLATVSAAAETQTVSLRGGGGTDGESWLEFEENPVGLVPASPRSDFPVDGIAWSGIGYVDGKLHLQTAVSASLDNDNHGTFYWKDAAGNRIDCTYGFSFSGEDAQMDYCEYVFELPQEELNQAVLYGDFVTSGMKTEGNWSVTFPLENAGK